MRLRSLFLVLIAVTVVCLSLAGGGIYWVLAQSPLGLKDGGTKLMPEGAMFVPAQAPAMVSLLVNPDRLEALLQLETPLSQRRRSRKELDEIKAGLLAKTNLNYYADVKGWLGDEITVAMTSLDYDRNPENGRKAGYLLVVSAKDGESAKEFLQLFFSRSAIAGDADLVFEPYQGVNLIYTRSRQTEETSLASAVVGDRYVLFANHPKVLRDAINNVQATSINLAHSENYKAALATIKMPRISVAYANLLALTKDLEGKPTEPTPTLTLAFGLDRQGLLAQSALSGVVKSETPQPLLSEPIAALSYLPSQTILTAAGVDLQGFWQQILTGFGENSPISDLFVGALNQWQDPWGLNLPEDIFSWVRGEYALSLLPNDSPGETQWLFVSQRDEEDRDKIEANLAHLDDLAKEQGLNIGNVTLGEQPVKIWAEFIASGGKIDADVRGVYTMLDDYQLISNSLDAIAKATNPNFQSLAESATFQEAIAPLPSENNGYLYINWRKVRPIFEEKFPGLRLLELAGQPLFDRLHSLTLTSIGNQEGVSRATMLLKMGLKDR
ncbi:DUF3352 domain-containing protein [Spirulina sp. 06S082]|uniref:DUF3352 domain-containing protein n=1 Tax=Spirulina sp. 06S082 TaxID=3110248 RepID=UPI002B20C3EB|nr:DUF3352 domain-containing protein [Spirulina sp. 06S082]MEA5469177.1 DUF3352 domain-containing protein [Spirulina sp. 06S082]